MFMTQKPPGKAGTRKVCAEEESLAASLAASRPTCAHPAAQVQLCWSGALCWSLPQPTRSHSWAHSTDHLSSCLRAHCMNWRPLKGVLRAPMGVPTDTLCCIHGERARATGTAGSVPVVPPPLLTFSSAEHKQIKAAQFHLLGQSSTGLLQLPRGRTAPSCCGTAPSFLPAKRWGSFPGMSWK